MNLIQTEAGCDYCHFKAEGYFAFLRIISSVTPLLATTLKVSSSVLRRTAGKVHTTPLD